MRTIQQLVSAEVHYCVSGLVATLAGATAPGRTGNPLTDLVEQAMDLASPIPDYESAARENGWELDRTNGRMFRHIDGDPDYASSWEQACEKSDCDPYDREVFEHWLISDWLADKLEAKGEKVDRDFAGMTIWARTTTGQSIQIDSVIASIHADLVREYGA